LLVGDEDLCITARITDETVQEVSHEPHVASAVCLDRF